MTCKYFCKCERATNLLNRNSLNGEIKIFYNENCNGDGNCGELYDNLENLMGEVA